MTELKRETNVIRRGLGSAIGTSRKKFSHILVNPTNGLFTAHLENVEVKNVTIGEDKTGMPSFNGMDIPKLSLTFASNEDDANKRHYVTLQFMPVESNANTIPGGKEQWKVDAVFNWLKHILNVYYLKGRDFTEEEIESLSLNYVDFDDAGEYVPVSSEEVVAAWRSLFENFENIMNRGKDGKPVYKVDSKNIPVWIKLLRYVKNPKKGWSPVSNGDLAFPTFVGEGCIEIFKQNTPSSIRLDVSKECVIPKDIENKPKTPNMGINGMMPTIPVGDNMQMGGITNIEMSAAEDMPF